MSASGNTAWIARLSSFAALFAYLSLPRAYIHAKDAQVVVDPIAPFLALTACLVGGILALCELLGPKRPALARGLLVATLQSLFLLRAVEAGLTVAFGFGFNSLFFAHAGFEAIRIGLVDYGGLAAIGVAALLAGTWPLLRMARWLEKAAWAAAQNAGSDFGAPQRRWARTAFSLGVLVVALALIESADPNDRTQLSILSFARAAARYTEGVEATGGGFLDSETPVLEALGIRFDDAYRYPALGSLPDRPPNLILVLLESFQDNFTAKGGSPFESLTPNLDRAVSKMTRVENAYNAVTPTMIAMTSMLCGNLPPALPEEIDGTHYSDLRCLTDFLADAGYRQVFMGAAEKAFTEKGAFLTRHGYDEVYGHEDWKLKEKHRRGHRSTWGIHDTALVGEAIERLEQLVEGPPFNLTLLTINSHKPGYAAPDCPTYESGNPYLNGIHCTDHAMGALLNAIERLGLFENSVVVFVGDHMAFPIPDTVRDLGPEVSNNYFGNVFMAIHSPRLDLPASIDTYTYSPDLAPTILDLLGIELRVGFQFGKSLLGERESFQHLIGPETEILHGVAHPKKRRVLAREYCTPELVADARLESADALFSPCQRMRLVTRLDTWLQGVD